MQRPDTIDIFTTFEIMYMLMEKNLLLLNTCLKFMNVEMYCSTYILCLWLLKLLENA